MANAAIREREGTDTVQAAAPTTPMRAHRGATVPSLSRPRLAKRLPVLPREQMLAVPLPDFVLVGAVDVRRGPVTALVEGARGRLFATTPGSDSVAVVDLARMAVLGAVKDVYEPFAAVQARGRAYVSGVMAANDELIVIDTASAALLETHAISGTVRDLVASADGNRVFLTRADDDGVDIVVFDTATSDFSSIPLGGPGATADTIAVSPDGTRLFVGVADNFVNDVVVVDVEAGRVVNAISVDAPIRAIAVHPSGATIYVLTSDPVAGGAVHVVDVPSGRVTSVAQTGGLPTSMSISRDGGRLYVADIEQITVVCTATATVVEALTVDAEPSRIVESADGSALYVADFAGRVTVFSIVSR